VDGPEPAPGTCGGCGARFEGGGDTPRDAAVRTLGAFGSSGDPDRLVAGLFESDGPSSEVAITSDRRDGFYRWWIFVAGTSGAKRRLAELARPVAGG
jgi:hypothetical protein